MAQNSTDALRSAATGTEVQTAPKKTEMSIANLMADPKVKAQMALALPKHMNADRMTRIALTEIRKTPDLAKCTVPSFMGAIMQCAQIGLEPGSALGHAYLIPFENRQKSCKEVQFIIGFKGMIDLARRSGQIESLQAVAVYEKDDFNFKMGLKPDIHHVPNLSVDDRGALTFVYAVANLKGGGTQFEVMSRKDVEKIRAKSKAGKYGPWADYFDEMAKKTVIRRLFKYLPVSIEIQRAVEADEKADAGISQDNEHVIDGSAVEVMSDSMESIDSETGEVTDSAGEEVKS